MRLEEEKAAQAFSPSARVGVACTVFLPNLYELGPGSSDPKNSFPLLLPPLLFALMLIHEYIDAVIH